MSQMNTRIRRITHLQSRLVGFAPALENVSSIASSASGDDDDKASATSSDDEMTTS